ncbi:MAG: ISXO2-like transposase domain protein [Bacteroidetes bacterium ADurb.Bin035]|jgi:transposase|nr:IS1595 family transposase [Bacteroidota bacterium]OQC43475.1 MAG: ISXO2-like transposase domain protein [Bacteroidetes bacterium ADurb.Bin035]HNW20946.1 IS1595 family transposase [Bacteroidales bacterium]HOY90640.1 IS1595 family transposase [Bacteroidales bacterium]HQC59773.1 IS1595 family transposase [Bacteroidales bacterium]
MVINSDFLMPIFRNKKRQKIGTSYGHIICPKCEVRTKLYKLKDGRRKCTRCGKIFVVNSKVDKRRTKIYADVIVGFCLDFSALKTTKLFKYNYSVVLSIYKEIRKIIAMESMGKEKLDGIVEVDESYFGGENRKRNKKYRKPKVGRGRGTDKTPVFGIKERNGEVYIEPLMNVTEKYIESIIENQVKSGTIVMSDEFKSYKGLVYKGYIHRFVEHNKEEYVNGDVHINGIENFWGWAKEHMMKYHGVFGENLFLYLKELEWKFNNRDKELEDLATQLAKLIVNNNYV